MTSFGNILRQAIFNVEYCAPSPPLSPSLSPGSEEGFAIEDVAGSEFPLSFARQEITGNELGIDPHPAARPAGSRESVASGDGQVGPDELVHEYHPAIQKWIYEVQKAHDRLGGWSATREEFIENAPLPPDDPRVFAVAAFLLISSPAWPAHWLIWCSEKREESWRRMWEELKRSPRRIVVPNSEPYSSRITSLDDVLDRQSRAWELVPRAWYTPLITYREMPAKAPAPEPPQVATKATRKSKVTSRKKKSAKRKREAGKEGEDGDDAQVIRPPVKRTKREPPPPSDRVLKSMAKATATSSVIANLEPLQLRENETSSDANGVENDHQGKDVDTSPQADVQVEETGPNAPQVAVSPPAQEREWNTCAKKAKVIKVPRAPERQSARLRGVPKDSGLPHLQPSLTPSTGSTTLVGSEITPAVDSGARSDSKADGKSKALSAISEEELHKQLETVNDGDAEEERQVVLKLEDEGESEVDVVEEAKPVSEKAARQSTKSKGKAKAKERVPTKVSPTQPGIAKKSEPRKVGARKSKEKGKAEASAVNQRRVNAVCEDAQDKESCPPNTKTRRRTTSVHKWKEGVAAHSTAAYTGKTSDALPEVQEQTGRITRSASASVPRAAPETESLKIKIPPLSSRPVPARRSKEKTHGNPATRQKRETGGRKK